MTPGAVADTLTAPFNDLDAVAALFEEHDDIAAVILEPVVGNMGLVLPQPGFLQGLRELTSAHGALLVFDEVMTGFRVHPGGAQALYGVTPDLTTLGKVIGGGLPVGAYGGRREIMELVAPAGARLPGGDALRESARDDGRDRDAARDRRARRLGRSRACRRAARGWPCPRSATGVQVARAGTMFGVFFSDVPVTSWDTATTGRHEVASPRSIERCSTEVCIWLRRSSKPASFRRPTATRRSTRRSKPQARLSPLSDPPVYASQP